jgi:glutathione synthase/RimK-type ligase-like ATP-grasp enzyme
MDAASLVDRCPLITDGAVAVEGLRGSRVELAGARGWIRRLAPEGWREEPVKGSHGDVARGAWVQALAAALSQSAADWLTELRDVFDAEDKLRQYGAAGRLGIEVPKAVVTTDARLLPDDLGSRIVVKPLGLGHYIEEGGEARVVHATAMDRSDSRLRHLQGAPFICQREVQARWHLRVVTVADRAWCCELDARDAPLDWRAAEHTHGAFVPVDRTSTCRDAVRLARAMRVGYSSQDWIVDADGQASFIDLNPAGQWLFLPDQVATAVTHAIADWLAPQVS